MSADSMSAPATSTAKSVPRKRHHVEVVFQLLRPVGIDVDDDDIVIRRETPRDRGTDLAGPDDDGAHTPHDSGEPKVDYYPWRIVVVGDSDD